MGDFFFFWGGEAWKEFSHCSFEGFSLGGEGGGWIIRGREMLGVHAKGGWKVGGEGKGVGVYPVVGQLKRVPGVFSFLGDGGWKRRMEG